MIKIQELILLTYNKQQLTNSINTTANTVMDWMSVSTNKTRLKYRIDQTHSIRRWPLSVETDGSISSMSCVFLAWKGGRLIRLHVLPQPQPAPWLANASCPQINPQHPPHSPTNQPTSWVTAGKQQESKSLVSLMLPVHMSWQAGPRRTTGAAELNLDRQIRDGRRPRLASKTFSTLSTKGQPAWHWH